MRGILGEAVAPVSVLRLWVAVFAMLAVLALPACSGGGDDDDDDSADVSNDPTSTPRPGRTPTPEPSVAPLFSPGGWNEGEARVTTSGGATVTVAGTLLARSSSSDKQNTRLTYAKDLETINISISRQYQPFAMPVYQAPVYIQSSSAGDSCAVTYKTIDEKRVEGSFRCTGARVEQGGNGQPATLEGTFFATR
jgi:hypothetical protein